MVKPVGAGLPSSPPNTAAQELARFLGLPSYVELPNNALLALQDFTAETRGSKVVYITAEYIRVNPRGDVVGSVATLKHFELREVKS